MGMRWFPDHKGMITGAAVAGFGFGALGWVKIAGGWGDLMGYGAMTEDFLACLRDRRRRPHSDLARARRALAIVLRAYGLL